jgi:predicted nucleic acid-binding protein
VILIDTSIWIEHLRSGNPELAGALEVGRVLTHPFIIGELACGNLKNRREVLDLLKRLPAVPTATHGEVMAFIEQRALMGRGIGYVDAHLLASVALATPARLWTRDKPLAAVAVELDLAHRS